MKVIIFKENLREDVYHPTDYFLHVDKIKYIECVGNNFRRKELERMKRYCITCFDANDKFYLHLPQYQEATELITEFIESDKKFIILWSQYVGTDEAWVLDWVRQVKG